jgi:methanogenic corrinoid protein MtbC1
MIKELEEVDYKKSAVSTVITSADETAPEVEEHRQFLINYILAGDHKQALKLIQSLASDAASLQAIYVDLIMPVMYAIGNLWEQGQITTAHEHLATSIVIRIMSDLYGNAAFYDQTRGKAIVSSAANENHEIGARMVADILQLNGWQVFYLGADTPEQKILIDKRRNPDLLALSITMSYNIKTAANIINSIRSHDSARR